MLKRIFQNQFINFNEAQFINIFFYRSCIFGQQILKCIWIGGQIVYIVYCPYKNILQKISSNNQNYFIMWIKNTL